MLPFVATDGGCVAVHYLVHFVVVLHLVCLLVVPCLMSHLRQTLLVLVARLHLPAVPGRRHFPGEMPANMQACVGMPAGRRALHALCASSVAGSGTGY